MRAQFNTQSMKKVNSGSFRESNQHTCINRELWDIKITGQFNGNLSHVLKKPCQTETFVWMLCMAPTPFRNI